MSKKEIALQVLDYWFAIAFMEQDSYNNCTDELDVKRKLLEYKKLSEADKQKRKTVTVFENLTNQSDVYATIRKQAEECGMSTWGNLTFYIGKIKRQKCIEKLSSELGISVDQAEDSMDDIPILSFQCNSQGQFINYSLSLSTIIWALSRVSGKEGERISALLSEEEYKEKLRNLEKRYFSDENSNVSISQSEPIEQGKKSDTPIFEVDAISIDRLNAIFDNISDFCQKYVGESLEYSIGLKFQLFKSLTDKEKRDDDDYLGLSHDFYSSDIKMLKSYLETRTFDFDKGMLADLVSFICAPYDGLNNSVCHNLLAPKDEDAFVNEMSDILNMSNSPIGKWPSRYMPAFMQQVAINFAISEKSRGVFCDVGKIFSVNGPPGTGKTTLLKEIVANNVVEKAVLLSEYDTPDDAFEEVKFEGGPYNGAYVPPKNGCNTSPYPKWYKFKNDRIADYGVLVTSCNNAAVENITKELPLNDGLMGGLKPITDGEHADSDEFQEQLGVVRRMFSVKDTDERFELFKKKNKQSAIYPEVYFTGYAQRLLGSDNRDADAWGLVAVPLGKKQNVRDFYYDVLDPLCKDLMLSNKDVEAHLPKYKQAQKNFLEQLNKVKALQQKLSKYGETTLNEHKARKHSSEIETRNTSTISELKSKRVPIVDELVKTKESIESDKARVNDANNRYTEIERKIEEYEEKRKLLLEQERYYRQQANNSEQSVSILTRIFRKTKYENALKLAKCNNDYADDCDKSQSELLVQIDIEKNRKLEVNKERDRAKQVLESDKGKSSSLALECERIDKEVQLLQSEIEYNRQLASKAQTEKNALLETFVTGDQMRTGCVLDDDFIRQVLSDNVSESTEAHSSNPWTTEEYNREREKLFFLALQMTKFFVLSSKHCRANLSVLGQYWGYKLEDGIGKIVFRAEDKNQMVGSLYNTLFLLAPVISSTFASVGTLFKDIKEPGVFGTLIIDEAGQAQPHMSIGTLFRSRRSIIVGDPKQVEPVVTDDLKLLKESYSEAVYSNYKNKSLSVQSCADIINPFGTFFENGTDYPEWVGCPLIVHRRCISPMYEISNRISYNGIMRQRTLPPSDDVTRTFVFSRSQWMNCGGTEQGNGKHFVPEQGDLVCIMVNAAFGKATYPDLFIISPFKSVVSGIKQSLGTFAKKNKNTAIGQSKVLDTWIGSNIGTIHKFQGKEANEVILLLGCDETVKGKYAVKGFVNSNIVNVAVTRAKYRLCIVGNMNVWCSNQYIKEAKSIIDTLPIENITEIKSWEESEEKKECLIDQVAQLPKASSFVTQIGRNENGDLEYDINTDEFVSRIDEANFLSKDLSDEQYRRFGFESRTDFNVLPANVKKNLILGMKLYYLLEPIYSMDDDLDASCCGILFCKGMELYLRQNFALGLKTRFPDYDIKNHSNRLIKLKDACANDLMIGTIQYILRNKMKEIGRYMTLLGEASLDESWWNSFTEKLKSFADKRNSCCHPQRFRWKEMQQMLSFEFEKDNDEQMRNPRIGGVFYESIKGRRLE